MVQYYSMLYNLRICDGADRKSSPRVSYGKYMCVRRGYCKTHAVHGGYGNKIKLSFFSRDRRNARK